MFDECLAWAHEPVRSEMLNTALRLTGIQRHGHTMCFWHSAETFSFLPLQGPSISGPALENSASPLRLVTLNPGCIPGTLWEGQDALTMNYILPPAEIQSFGLRCSWVSVIFYFFFKKKTVFHWMSLVLHASVFPAQDHLCSSKPLRTLHWKGLASHSKARPESLVHWCALHTQLQEHGLFPSGTVAGGRTVTPVSKLVGLYPEALYFMVSYFFKSNMLSGKFWYLVILIHSSITRGTTAPWNADFIHGTCFFFTDSLINSYSKTKISFNMNSVGSSAGTGQGTGIVLKHHIVEMDWRTGLVLLEETLL